MKCEYARMHKSKRKEIKKKKEKEK